MFNRGKKPYKKLKEDGMPEITGGQLKEMFKAYPKEISHKIGASLREFGYSNATDEAVEAEFRAQIENGAEPCNLNYGLWIKNYLKDGIS